MKYSKWLDEWLESYVKFKVKETTYFKYKHEINKYLKPNLGNYKLSELKTDVIQKYIISLSDNYAPNTINGIINLIKSSLKKAYKLSLIKDDSLLDLVRPKVIEKKIECFNLLEQKKIENYIINKNDSKLNGIIFCLYTGIRLGELLALKWSDIYFKEKYVVINKTCHDKWENHKYVKIIDNPKTNNSFRIIPLPNTLIELIKKHKPKDLNSYLVKGRNNEGCQVRSYQKTFKRLLIRLKIQHRGFHSLRHTFATRAIELGVDIKTLSEILGHKNTSITLNRYAHSLLNHKRDMMNKLGKLLK